ncbi:hypothetical protein DAMA08_006830 [Martiniozyma asiatica (nom. inval.)]|nr:hypothetical protein DAMA08_006830 [Martiniozyma asiatica]
MAPSIFEHGEDITVLHKDLAHIPFTNTIKFYLNGKVQTVKDPNPEQRLIDWIRDEANLTGTKEACSESGCNACSVSIATIENGEIHYRSVNSCVTPLLIVDGKHIITVEGVGSTENPHPVQERIAKFHGSQCGYCTPGFVMNLYTLLREKNGKVSTHDIDEALESNLCRCTGYMPIVDAAYSFAYDSDNYNSAKIRPFTKKLMEENKDTVCALGDKCCKNKKENLPECSSENNDNEIDINALYTQYGESLKAYDIKNDIPFPDKLSSIKKNPIFYGNEYKVWFRPVTKQQLLEIVNSYPDCKIVAGASEVQIEVKFKAADYKVSVFCNEISELKGHSYIDGKGLSIGANIPLIDLQYICDDLALKLDINGSGQVYKQIADQLKLFASKAVRNVATPAGNIVTASPIADLNPILVACSAIITAEKINPSNGQIETIELNMRDDFFTGYRKTKLPTGYVITEIFIPQTKKNEFIHIYKQSKRKDDDISIVTACLNMELNDLGEIVESTLVYGGMAPMTVQSKQTQMAIHGKSIFDEDFIQLATDKLMEDYNLPFDVPGGMATFRRSLTISFFFKFWQYILSLYVPADENLLIKKENLFVSDSLTELTRNQKHSWRDLDVPRNPDLKIVGKNIVHVNALKQASGEAIYTDDIPLQHNEIFGAQVMSTHAHAKIKSIDWSKALEIETVIGHITKDDLPTAEANYFGPLPFGKEPFMAEDEVFYVGQTIGVIWATDRERAYEAARKVKIEYEPLPAIVDVEDGVEVGSFFPSKEEPDARITTKGDWETAFQKSEHFIEGSCRLTSQEHFYFEPNNSLVIPEEDGELKVYSSSQNLHETQEYAAQVTGVHAHRVIAKVKRLGGGFGGKESRAALWSSLCAIAAKKYKRPARIILRRDEDMLQSGERHPFFIKYRVSLDDEYKFTGLDMNLYANAGWSMDLTRGVIDRAVLHSVSCYNIPNVRICGIPVKTNVASNTAYRTFGAQAGFYAIESIITNLAEKFKVDPEFIREKNYLIPNSGQTFSYHQIVNEDLVMKSMVAQNMDEYGYQKKREEVEQFNATHKYKKRGLAHVPACFGLAFGVLWLNQAGALVNIYQDGSVLIATGGVEIGQGISTVMRMIAAENLGVPFEKVYLSETSTQAVPNASPTAASSGSDLNGMALKNAIEKINQRLEPIKDKLNLENPGYTWEELIQSAYFERVSLSATGFYKTPDIGFVFGDSNPNPKPAFSYHTQGSAIVQTEIDVLTGEWVMLDASLKMDVGKPLNPAIIYGQIEGAFMQGVGYFTMEQSLWVRKNSSMFTRGPGNYKIPGWRDVPQDFKVSMYKGSEHRHLRTIHSSKGVGEPPFFLGASAYFSIRDAISYARKDLGLSGCEGLPFRTPMSVDKIRNYCADPFMKKAEVIPAEGQNDFFVEA